MKKPEEVDPFVARALTVLRPDDQGRVGYVTDAGMEAYKNYPNDELQIALRKYLEIRAQQNSPAIL